MENVSYSYKEEFTSLVLKVAEEIEQLNKYLELDVSFYMSGIISELIKYFRNQSDYSLEEIHTNGKRWFDKVFK